MIELDEDKLELLYWEFDSRVKKKNFSDRDCFKQVVRSFTRSEIERLTNETN